MDPPTWFAMRSFRICGQQRPCVFERLALPPLHVDPVLYDLGDRDCRMAPEVFGVEDFVKRR